MLTLLGVWGSLENVTPEPPGLGVSPSWPERVGLKASSVCSEGGGLGTLRVLGVVRVPRGSKKGPTWTRTHSLSPHAFFRRSK